MKILAFILVFLSVFQFSAQFSPGELTNAHRSLEGTSNCTKCHTLGAKISEQKCLSCHKELSARIKANKGLHATPALQSKSCVSCHSEHHGRSFESIRFETKTFDHQKTGYALVGGHQNVNCRECHQPKNIENSSLKKNKSTYLGLQQKCTSCHDDYHQGTLSNSCLNCHQMKSFQNAAKFDHSKSSFPLKGKHKEVSCVECHKVGTRNNKKFQFFSNIEHSNCTSCHKDPHENKFGQSCTKCHNEWSWKANAAIQQGFDHSKTNFPLIGLHQGVSCKSCHKTNLTNPVKHQRCMDCHKDYHEGEFISSASNFSDCKDCHSVDKPFSFSSFDLAAHQDSKFPLTGAHQATSCLDCHKPNPDQRWSFKFADQRCVSCHKDIHDGYILEPYAQSQNCTACHQTSSWKTISFDHSQTAFKIDGAHQKVSCRNCHFLNEKENVGQPVQRFKNTPQNCNACHDDIHEGQFILKGQNDCARCHSIEVGWPTPFFNHQITLFPLDGKHKEISCGSCHKSQQKESGKTVTLYKIQKFECIDCHGS